MTTTTAPPDAPSSANSPGSAIKPGLDGLRGLMLMPVLLFHSGFMFARGAMFGLSTFFTLSGYLITTLLIEERRKHGTIALGNFWKRRFRRLLPASLLAMALAIAFAVFAGDTTQRAEVGGDVVASLGYVANWWFLISGQSYFDLFSGPSPLLHIWSLAVEEQFYMVLPLVAWGLLRHRSLTWFTTVIVVSMVVTTSLPLVFNLSDDWIYYSTPTRLPEMLAGVLLAVVLATGNRRSILTRPGSTIPTAIAGGAALAVMVWLWHNVGLDTPWVYRGGFAAFSLVSIVLIMAVHNRSSPVTRAITVAPCCIWVASPTASTCSTGRCSCGSARSAPASTVGRCSPCAWPWSWLWPSPRSISSKTPSDAPAGCPSPACCARWADWPRLPSPVWLPWVCWFRPPHRRPPWTWPPPNDP